MFGRKAWSAIFGVGAAASAVGSLLPWLRVPARVGVPRTLLQHCVRDAAGALDCTALHGDGAFTLALGATAVGAALYGVLRGGRRSLLFAMLLLSAASLFFSGAQLWRMPSVVSGAPGLWLAFGGAALMLVAVLGFTWALQHAPAESMERSLPILPG